MQRIEIIGEAGVGHSGDVNVALKMIDAAKEAGADVVKFQTYNPDAAINANHRDFGFLKSLALTHADFLKLKKHCDEVRIEFLSTPGDVGSLKFLIEECGIRRIKIGSDDLTFRPLLAEAAESGLPIILSTGMASLEEVGSAWGNLGYQKITFLHCVSSYPCALQDANLRAITKLQNTFNMPVGYSDHCQGFVACLGAAALGATIIEKHFELRDHRGPDHEVSISEFAFERMVVRLREVELLLGTGIKVPCEAEKQNIPFFRKREDGKKMA